MKISTANGKRNKIHISIDGEYTFTVDAEYWYSCPYYAKENIEEGERAVFLEAVGSRAAFNAGLSLLSYRDHTEKEIHLKLRQKGFDKNHIANAVEKLKDYGYVNDKRVAENYAKSLYERKGMSQNGIKNELRRKGISADLASNITESIDFDPVLRIIELLNSKYSRYLGDEKGIRKTVASLQRLGYKWSDIRTALRSVEVETEDNEDV